MHWMRGQHDKHCFIHISMPQTKQTLAGLLCAGGEQLFDYNWTQPKIQCSLCFYNKTAQGAEDHMDLSLKLFFPWQPVQPGLSQPQDRVTACKLCDIQTPNSALIQSLQLRVGFHLYHTYFRCFVAIYLEGYEQLQEQMYKLSSKGQI